jgi:beta-aspartyl-peptidase (threonine type)
MIGTGTRGGVKRQKNQYFTASTRKNKDPSTGDGQVAIAVHGGAGGVAPGMLTADGEREHLAALETALLAGHEILQAGGPSVEAVTAAVKILEDSPFFNAGLGSVYTADGHHELDAAIMDGADRSAGAVAGLFRVRNPIELAKGVMEFSPHVLLIGQGAERFAEERGIELVPNHYFDTPERLETLLKVQARIDAARRGELVPPLTEHERHGTVGCVALDCEGNLAAATSTGGMTNKRPGRVGDSPLIGSGTFADNASCAVSATGHGEYFIRWVVAHEIASIMRYTNQTVEQAAHAVIHNQLRSAGGTGGVIAIDRHGSIAMPFNTTAMFRGSIDVDGVCLTAIY